MPDRDAKKLERQLDRISAELPSRVGGFLRWLRGPSSRWVRVPAGLLLIIGGVVGFLPVLGFWMVPLGALLLAQDIPFLRRPVLQLLAWLERECIKWKSQRSRGGGKAMKPFTTATLITLALVAIVHALRVLMGWSVIVNGSNIPMWVSVVAVVISAGLASDSGAKRARKSEGLSGSRGLGSAEKRTRVQKRRECSYRDE